MNFRLPAPHAAGYADVDGVQIAWQSFGDGESAVLVVPTWNFVDSRVSAPLVPDLAAWFRVVTFDPRGAGRSDRPSTGYRFSDSVPLETGEAVAAAIPNATFAVATSGGHRPDIRSPELINPLFVDFLRGRLPTSRPGIEIR
jgi:pimeloyl-ACP methyl ester carboxylesterase